MTYPPWLPKPDPSRRGMLLALARCIHEMWYKPEPHVELGSMVTFDNLCSGGLEHAAVVLQKAGFTSYIDPIGRRSVFEVGPDHFEEIADRADDGAVGTGEIKAAVVALAKSSFRRTDEIDALCAMIEAQP